jgi:predicted MFS family arabinose efflux permease
MELVSYTAIFLICLGLGICALCIAAVLRVELAPEEEEADGIQTEPDTADAEGAGGAVGGNAVQGRLSAFRLRDYVEPRSVPIALVIMTAALCYAGVQSFISFYAKEIDQVAASTLYFLVYALVSLVSRPLSGKIFDSKGESAVVYPAIFFLGCSQLVLSIASGPWLVLLSGALLALGYGNLLSICQALAVKLAPRRRFGQATSTYFILLDLGIGLGPSCLGLLVPFVGYSGMFMVTTVVGFAVYPLYYFLHGRKAGRVS